MQINCECETKVAPQIKCNNQASIGSSAVALAGVQGAGSPLAQKLSKALASLPLSN